MSLSQLAIAFVSYVIDPHAMVLYVFVHFVSCVVVYDKEFKMRWNAYLAEHANPHCHFHANCLCKCTECTTLRCACPVGSAACAETRHPGDEYYGVNLDSHERKAYENIMGVRTVIKIVAVVAVPSIVIVALPANLLVATGAVEFNIVYRAVYMFMFLVIQTVLFQGLVLLDSNVREKITRCNAVNIIAMIAIYVVATILVGGCLPSVIVVRSGIDVDVCFVLSVLPLMLASGMFTMIATIDEMSAWSAYQKKHRNPACQIHPACLCTCALCVPCEKK